MDFLDSFTAQNDCLVIGFLMVTEIFTLQPNLWPWQLFKEGYHQKILADFSKSHNFGLERTFWTFSVLKIIVLSLAIRWAQKYFDFGLICA